MEQEKKILTVDEVAERLRLHRRTVIRLIKKGELPGMQIGGQWRVLTKQLEAYLEGNTDGN